MKVLLFVAWVVLLVLVASAIAYFVGSPEVAVERTVAVAMLTLLVGGGGTFLVIYAVRMHRLDIPAEELNEGERVWAKTTHAVHYKTGRTWRFWEAVGGKLFLTDQVLEFRANPAEWWVYRVRIPLRDVDDARPCRIGFAPGGLRVERDDGSFELFTFGAAFNVSREWADAILDFRDDLAEQDR